MNFGNQDISRHRVKTNVVMSSEGATTEFCRKPRSSKVMTQKKLNEQIRLGFGQGHGSSYQPWLKVRRKNSSPSSNQVVAWMPPLGRTAHYFSRGEYHTALVLLWLGVSDLREQFPLWPMPHPNPLEEAIGAENMEFSWSRGLLQIASEAGINHGVEFGTIIPYVATIDLLAMVFFDDGPRLIGISSKPIEYPDEEVKLRTLERLELERRYFNDIDAGYFVTSAAIVPGLMASQLEWWMDASILNQSPDLIPLIDCFADRVNQYKDQSISEVVTETSQYLSISLDAAWTLFKHCAWTQKIDIDPSIRVVTSHPIKPGGVELRKTLRQKFFGRDWK